MRPQVSFVGRLARAWGLGAVLALVLSLWGTGAARAKVEPYYVVTAERFGNIRPKVLIVLDTSNSMAHVGDASGDCTWNDCEDPTHPDASRIAVARSALRTMVLEWSDSVDFALMTFETESTPTTVPPKCVHSSGVDRRFIWVTERKRYNGVSYDPGTPLIRYPGVVGSWQICAEVSMDPSTNKSLIAKRYDYPYLRADELGVGASVSEPFADTDPLPASPMISTAPADFAHDTNSRRRVQWFPDFHGVRVRLDATTDPGQTILNQTIGDYGSTLLQKQAEVWGRDFYYWPYVDGFPGYGPWQVLSPSTDAYAADRFNAGVSFGTARQVGSLVVPFYLENSGLPAADEGPTKDENMFQLLRRFDSLTRGGIDPHSSLTSPITGSTGWVPPSAPATNAVRSHESAAAYFRFLLDDGGAGLCSPLALMVVTDAELSATHTSWSSANLSRIRRHLGADIYVVGMFLPVATDDIQQINHLACGGTGACPEGDPWCNDPCNGSPVDNWDTCKNPDDPANDCAYIAQNPQELIDAVRDIMRRQMAEATQEASAGAVGRFVDVGVGAGGQIGRNTNLVVTTIAATTETPGWKGHVRREVCSDPDPDDPGELASWCEGADEWTPEELAEPTFGNCPRSRSWDAGECLRQRSWQWRTVLSSRADGSLYYIHNPSQDRASNAFRNELIAQNLIPNDADADANATAIARFIKGKDWPDGWTLPGLADSSPTLIRRVPPFQAGGNPTVAIRDPHCAGRGVPAAGLSVPPSLEQFAQDEWDPAQALPNPTPHLAAQELVLVGSDIGMLHAFHYDTGNEMWAYIPPFMFANAVAQYDEGVTNRGQPASLSTHHFGVSATPNQGWVYDAGAAKWRHVAVLGFGVGGEELVALDVTHGSSRALPWPFEVLWTSEDAALKASYDPLLGETWARPALTYETNPLNPAGEPNAYFVVGGGYPGSSATTGRQLALVDALSGTVLESADLAAPGKFRWDSAAFGTPADPVVATHCRSRLWSEMEEVYVLGLAGRLFRWDLGGGPSRPHTADGGTLWSSNGPTGSAPMATFWSCKGTGATCAVDLGTTRMREPFYFSPAVSSLDRIDNLDGQNPAFSPVAEDQFLLAFASGTPWDPVLEVEDTAVDFHTSLYILRDDHRFAPQGGLNLAPGQAKLEPAKPTSHPGYFRAALSDFTRTRIFTPFPGAPTYTETGFFSPSARPAGPPRISVRSAAHDAGSGIALRDDIELYFVEFQVYEPPGVTCDTRWYDTTAEEWHQDLGSSYTITFRLSARDDRGFNFVTGAGAEYTLPSGGNGLTLLSVEQHREGNCADGSCGPGRGVPPFAACIPAEEDDLGPENPAVPLSQAQLSGFTPGEG